MGGGRSEAPAPAGPNLRSIEGAEAVVDGDEIAIAGEIAKEMAAAHPAGARGDQANEGKQPGVASAVWQVGLNDRPLGQEVGVATAPGLQMFGGATGFLAGHDVNDRRKLHAVRGHPIIEIEMVGANFLE